MSVFSGATGKIIGPKGAKIQEIKRVANVKDIKMPAKSEDGTRPKARELVELTITGKPRAIAKARELIQGLVDEWVCLSPSISFCFAFNVAIRTDSAKKHRLMLLVLATKLNQPTLALVVTAPAIITLQVGVGVIIVITQLEAVVQTLVEVITAGRPMVPVATRTGLLLPPETGKLLQILVVGFLGPWRFTCMIALGR